MSAAAPSDDQALRRFADHYGFEHGLLAGSDPYRIEGATAGFTGAVTRIRVVENGRFGNIFTQLLHAAWLARQLGCGTVEAFAFEAGPPAERIDAGGLSFLFPRGGRAAPPAAATLTGHFFNSYPFESALRGISPPAGWDLVQSTMRPLFRHIWAVPALCGERTLVVHFRAGDVFRDPRVSPWYVQPPAAYYPVAIGFARRELGIQDVRLVFEDRANPAVALTEEWLRDQGIPFAVQSSDLARDAACLATATHLVASVSTLTEVAATLSQTLRTYIAFRHVESHAAIHQRTQPLVEGMLAEKDIRLLLVRDGEGGYLEPASWRADADQVRLLTRYPASCLSIAETRPDADAFRDPESLHARLSAAEIEATRLRDKLVQVQNRLYRLEQSRGQRLFRTIHAIRRALGLPWFGEPNRT